MVQPDGNASSALIAHWDFSEATAEGVVSRCGGYALRARGRNLSMVADGELDRRVMRFGGEGWLELPRPEVGALDRHGEHSAVTVAALVRFDEPALYQALAGIWDETHCLRQYCLFFNITSRYDARQQAHGHISHVGGPTPGFDFCVTYATGGTRLPMKKWIHLALAYDGKAIRVYVNGELDSNPMADPFAEGNVLNPYRYAGRIFNGGRDGAPFTVGGVHRSGEMGNWFRGRMADLRVYGAALGEKELRAAGIL